MVTITRKNRLTGTDTECGTAVDLSCDPAGGKWVTVCWTHGNLVNHETKRTALSWLSAPWEWCEPCQAIWWSQQPEVCP